ncbi:MAG: cytochrome-c peroxidase [Agriterribacter sp.]
MKQVNSAARVYYLIIGFLILGYLATGSCQPKQEPAATTRKTEDLGSIDALPLTVISPENNPSSPEKIELGRLLFYDPILSGGKDVACATCHHPEFGYAESLELSIGTNGKGLGEKRRFNSPNNIPFVKRNAQTLLNTAFNGIKPSGDYSPEHAPMFWDNRASSLEQQALMPVKTLEEMMGHDFKEDGIAAEVVSRVNNIPQYKTLFKEVFGGENAVSDTNISKALATFQRSLIANNSRFDQYMRGDKTAMSSRELEGMRLFMEAGCARCHSGPMLSDFKMHVLGVVDNEKLTASDSGFQGTYAFRTPTLRNLRRTRPYMHNGKIQTLESVLTFYEDLQGKELPNKNVSRKQLDTLALKLKVDFKHISAIVEFLNTLNDDNYDKQIPASVPSGLPVGGNIK